MKNTIINTTNTTNENGDITCPITGVVLITAAGEEIEGYTEINGVKYFEGIVDDYFTICDECGEYIPNDEIVEVNGQNYCQACIDEYFVECANCGEYVRRDDATYADGDYYCEDCRDEELCWCEDCEEYHRDYNGSHVESVGRWVCDNCLERYYTRCERCGEYIPDGNTVTVIVSDRGWTEEWCTNCAEYNTWTCDECGDVYSDDIEPIEDDWDRYCPNCRGGRPQDTGDINTWRSPRYREGYCFKPAPCLCATESERRMAGDDWKTKIIFYGFELEIDRNVKCDRENEWSEKIVDELPSTYCKKDCSLDKGGSYSGIEIVSHPATLAWYEERKSQFDSCFDMLKEGGWLSHDAGTCGLHVHISLHALEEANPWAVNNMLFLVDRFWDKLVKFSRRTEYQLNRWARRYSIARGTYEEIKNMAKRECDRYMSVNLQNEHTVEIRMFRGTLNTETFFATLQLIDTMVKRCIEIGNDVRKLQAMSWEEFVASDHAELNSYLKRRGLTEGSVEEPEPQEGSEPRELSYEDFSVGDRVRAIAAPDRDDSLIGRTGEVEEIEPDASRLHICVRFDGGRRWWCESRTLEIITEEEPVQQPETQRSVNGFSVGDHVYVNLLQNAGVVVPQYLSHGTVIGFSENDDMAAIAFDCPRALNEEYRVCTHDCSGLSSSLDSRWVSFDYMTLD